MQALGRVNAEIVSVFDDEPRGPSKSAHFAIRELHGESPQLLPHIQRGAFAHRKVLGWVNISVNGARPQELLAIHSENRFGVVCTHSLAELAEIIKRNGSGRELRGELPPKVFGLVVYEPQSK